MLKRIVNLRIRLGLKILTVFASFLLLFMVVSDRMVSAQASFCYDSVDNIPKNKVGLLLGTSKFIKGGGINLYYHHRIQAAVNLYHSGKIEYILISGDNGTKNYDEPTTMKNDLIALGVPANKIYLDYAGFRTLDSVVRSKEIFEQTSITIISQPFHNHRAIYLANKFGINAIGFNAKDVSKKYGLKVMLREKLARSKMMIDLLTRKKPKFYGEKVKIES